MVREAVKITATESAAIEVEDPRILKRLLNTQLEFHKEIVPELAGYFVVLAQDLGQIRLDALVELNFHVGAGRRPVRQT